MTYEDRLWELYKVEMTKNCAATIQTGAEKALDRATVAANHWRDTVGKLETAQERCERLEEDLSTARQSLYEVAQQRNALASDVADLRRKYEELSAMYDAIVNANGRSPIGGG